MSRFIPIPIILAAIPTIPKGEVYDIIFDKGDGELRRMKASGGRVEGSQINVFERSVGFRSFLADKVLYLRTQSFTLASPETEALRKIT